MVLLYFTSPSHPSHKLDSGSIQLKSFLLKTFQPNYRHLRHSQSVQIPSQLRPFSSISMDILVSHCPDHQVMLDNRPKLLKSFLLKKLLMQPKRSTETLKIAQKNYQHHDKDASTPYHPITTSKLFHFTPFTTQCYLQPMHIIH